MLVVGQGRGFAGGGADDQRVNVRFQLAGHQAFHGGVVDVTALGHGGDDGGADTFEQCFFHNGTS